MNEPNAERTWVPLSPRERRVVGVLIEKQKTTPEYYPMTIAAVVSGCNQKSNRDPVVSYTPDDVEETLEDLRHKGATILYEGSGRVPKWKHTLYDWLGLRNKPVEMAILAELLLRGPQTEGELRTRASRMDAIPDLAALGNYLRELEGRGLVVFLTPPGQKRGVVVTHGMYPPAELERVRQAHQNLAAEEEAGGPEAGRHGPRWAEESAALRSEIDTLRAEVRGLAEEVRALREALGA